MIKQDFDVLMNYKFNLKPMADGRDEDGNTYYRYSRDKGLQPLGVAFYPENIINDKSAKATMSTIRRKLELGEY